MKNFFCILLALLTFLVARAAEPFRIAQLTDIHLSRSNKAPLEDLKRSIDEINTLPDIAFVLITGDITEAGDRESMLVAKAEFDRLKVPYYCTSGNHETTWSESGCTDFSRVFGSDRFSLTYRDVFFVGFNSGPVLKMADGHVAPQDIAWAESLLKALPKGQKVVALTHYPLQEGDVDNWYDATALLRQYNTQCIIGGHYHRNLMFDADGLPNVLCRSNLRGKENVNGYSLISFGPDSIRFAEKVIGKPERQWMSLPWGDSFATRGDELPRPSYEVNKRYRMVSETWRRSLGVGIYSAPAYDGKSVYVGDDEGNMYCLDAKKGTIKWKTNVGSRINSTPVVTDGCVIFGETGGSVVSLSTKDGRIVRRYFLNYDNNAVMGCPVLASVNGKKAVLIGGNGHFYAFDAKTLTKLWDTKIQGYCVSRPCVYGNKVYFGAWGCFFYALNLTDGAVAWKWSNGTTNDKYSPAAVWPVASDGKIFIVAPDRVFTCLNAETGDVVYRTNQHQVRENIGLSTDGTMVFSRCMNDSVQAMSALADKPETIWKVSADYGYDHDPSMMLEKGGVIIFGTKNGLMHGVRAKDGKVLWRHKIGNCVVNTICPVSAKECFITSSDGNVIRLKAK